MVRTDGGFLTNLKKVKPQSFNDGMPKKHLPSIHLSSKDLSEIKDWEVGEIYKIALEVKQTSKSEREDGIDASFDIIKIAAK